MEVVIIITLRNQSKLFENLRIIQNNRKTFNSYNLIIGQKQILENIFSLDRNCALINTLVKYLFIYNKQLTSLTIRSLNCHSGD